MRDCSKEWCETGEISVSYIENLAIERVENFQEVDVVYLSPDLYHELIMHMASSIRYGGTNANGGILNTVELWTSAGRLTVKVAPYLMNFCHVGTESSYKSLEWEKISQEFEKVFLSE